MAAKKEAEEQVIDQPTEPTPPPEPVPPTEPTPTTEPVPPTEPTPTTDMITVVVLMTIMHNGQVYAPDSEITDTQAALADALSYGVVKVKA